MRLVAGLPDPLWELTALPRPHSWIKGEGGPGRKGKCTQETLKHYQWVDPRLKSDRDELLTSMTLL